MVTDAYPPMRTSCAVQMYDLAQAFIAEGHQVTVITPTSTQKERVLITRNEGVRLIQVKAFETKDINYVSRTLAEFINPFLIWHKLKKCIEFINTQYDGIIWYSPSIFWAPFIKRAKMVFGCNTYLILRDIFPDWAFHLKVLNDKSFSGKLLKKIAENQYKNAGTIGVQSPKNLEYFNKAYPQINSRVEVLWNWGGGKSNDEISKNYNQSVVDGLIAPLKEKKIFVYAGNMGVAQETSQLLVLIDLLAIVKEIAFLLVGRGSNQEYLKSKAVEMKLENVLFVDEIDSIFMPELFARCSAGLALLDQRHKSHNIPGKVISYLESGLPVFAMINPGNDLETLLPNEGVGRVWTCKSKQTALEMALLLLNDLQDPEIRSRCKIFSNNFFSIKTAQKKIETALIAKKY